MKPVWTAHTGGAGFSSEKQVEAAFSPQAAVLSNLDKLEIRDPVSGHMLHNIAVGEDVGDVAIADEVVVAQTDRLNSPRSSYRMLRAYDLKSGRQLWGTPVVTSDLMQTGRSELIGHGLRPATVTTRGVVVNSGYGWMAGLDLWSGKQRWSRPHACGRKRDALIRVSTTVTTTFVLASCGEQTLTAVNPRTGDTRDTEIPGRYGTLFTSPAAVGVSAKETMSIFADSGQLLSKVGGGQADGGFLLVNGDRAVTSDRHGGMYGVSLASGDRLWQRKTENKEGPQHTWSAGWPTDDGLLFVPVWLGPRQPSAISIVDVFGNVTKPIALPVKGEIAGTVHSMLFGVSQEDHGSRYTAFQLARTGTVESMLGDDVKATDWPDPCRLLSTSQTATLGQGYATRPTEASPTAARLRLPHSDRCNFIGGRHPFSLQVNWVAADAATAVVLAQSILPSRFLVRPVAKVGYQFPSPESPVADEAIMVQRRLVISVYAPGQAALTTRIAKLLRAGPSRPRP